jgi:hypothetical protein
MAVAAISMTKVAVPIIGSSSQAAIFLPARLWRRWLRPYWFDRADHCVGAAVRRWQDLVSSAAATPGSLRAPEAKDELAAVMASLVTIGWLEPEVPTNPAKPVSAWAVNPAVHVRFADRADREQARREKARADLAAYFAALNGKQAETDAA